MIVKVSIKLTVVPRRAMLSIHRFYKLIRVNQGPNIGVTNPLIFGGNTSPFDGALTSMVIRLNSRERSTTNCKYAIMSILLLLPNLTTIGYVL